MAYSALPTVAEAFVVIRDLKNGCCYAVAYLFLMDLLFYAVVSPLVSKCGRKDPILITYRTISIVFSMFAGFILLTGIYYKNWKFIRWATNLAMASFVLDTLGGFYYLVFVILSLEKCGFYLWFMATFGLFLPILSLLNIIVMHSYRIEMEFILRPVKDQELFVDYY